MAKFACISVRSGVRSRTFRLLVLPIVLTFIALPALGQGAVPTAQLFNGETATPLPGAHDYLHFGAETVNPSNGSVSIKFDFPLPKGRGISLPYTGTYNSAGLYHVTLTQNGVVAFVQNYYNGGSGYPTATWSVSSFTPPSVACPHPCVPPPPWGPCHVANGFGFTDQYGTPHKLGLGVMTNAQNYTNSFFCPNVGNSIAGIAIPPPGNGDGKVWAIFSSPGATGQSVTNVQNSTNGEVGPFTVTDKDGTTYFFAGGGIYDSNSQTYFEQAELIEDRNGNYIGSNLDTLGRQMSGVNASGEGTVGGLAYPSPTCPSCPSTVAVNYTPSYSTAVNTTGLQSYETMSCNDYSMHVSGTQPAVRMQTLPTSTSANPRQYTMYFGTYNPTDATLTNPYGLVNEIIYPNGGWVKYTWKMSNADTGNASSQFAAFTGFGLYNGSRDGSLYPGACMLYYSTPVLATRSVSYDGVNIAQTQSFKYTTTMPTYGWTAKTTSVTTTDNVSGITFLTVYNYGPGGSGPSDPFAWGSVASGIPLETSVLYYSGSTTASLLRTVTKSWASIFDLAEEDTAENGLTRKTVYTYDQTDNAASPFTLLKSQSDYDFGGTLVRKTNLQYQSFGSNTITVGGNTVTLPVPSQPNIATVQNSAGTTIAETDYSYDVPALTSMTGIVKHDDTNYGTGLTTRGNLTSLTKKCIGCTNATTAYHFDMTGQPVSTTDPNGNVTQYSFTDSPTGGNAPGQSNAYLTQITYPQTNGFNHQESFQYNYVFGDLTTSNDQNSQPTAYLYNDPFDRLTEADFPDGGKTTSCWSDNALCQTGSALPLTLTTSQLITSSLSKTTASIMDGMFHVTQTQLSTDPSGTDFVDATYNGLGQKRTVSNPHRTASSSTDGTTTTTTIDALGRPKLATEQDGSTVQTAYDQTCKANTNTLGTLVTDEAGHQRRSCTDGLGRLVEVDEPGGTGTLSLTTPFVTLYQYDPLDNLICVVQKGTSTTQFTNCASASATWRPRSFTYDSLSRLLSVKNPESGSINYAYDANGNLATKTAPLPNQASTGTATVITTYTYDALNRLSKKFYSDGTPTVQYGYDGAALIGCTKVPPSLPDTYPIGRRTSMCDGSGATSWDHDQMGRTKQDARFIGGVTPAKLVNYGYNLDGSLAFVTTPPLKTVAYTYNGAGQPVQAVDNIDGINFATNATYAPPGELFNLLNGGTIHAVATYNSRLQPLQMFYGTNTPPALTGSTCPSNVGNIMHRLYNFGLGSGDNGNALSVANCRDTTRTASFAYDALNRITSAQSSGSQWGETFTIDTWGNMTNEAGIAGKTNHEGLNTTAGTNNQLAGFGYDPAGNMTSNSAISATYVYDAENRLIWTSGYRYVYDGDGQRVEKCVAATSTTACLTSGTNGTLYWRGIGNDTLDESDLSGNPQEEYVFFNGRRIARRDVTSTGATIAVHYYFSDHLGTHAVVTDATGAQIEQDIDYYPYGGVQHDYSTAVVPQRYKFNGKERDTESGLDNFEARYDASSLGRFMTPDWAAKPTSVPYANFGNPQSLNLYSYVQNNPTTVGDRTGHCLEDACVVEGAIGAAMLVSYLSSPPGQQVLRNAVNDAAKVVGAISGLFRPSNSGQNAPTPPSVPTNVSTGTPGTTATNVATGTPASTSQQGTVDTSPKSLIVVSPGGDAIPVPNGASGPGPVINDAGKTTGFGYTGGSGGYGLDLKTTGVRVMDPTPARGASPGYPNGDVSYMNTSGQTVNGQTGRTVPRSDPSAHIPLSPPKPCPSGGGTCP